MSPITGSENVTEKGIGLSPVFMGALEANIPVGRTVSGLEVASVILVEVDVVPEEVVVAVSEVDTLIVGVELASECSAVGGVVEAVDDAVSANATGAVVASNTPAILMVASAVRNEVDMIMGT
jgi:hypothetical protein